MVVDHHQVARRKIQIDAASGIGKQHVLNAHQQQCPQGNHSFCGRISLITMKTPVKQRKVAPFFTPKNQLARMTRCGGNRKSRYIGIIKDNLRFNRIGIITKPRAQHNRNLRFEIRFGTDEVFCSHNLIDHFYFPP